MTTALIIQNQVPLAPLCSIRVGGPARHYVRVTSEEQLAAALSFARTRELAVRVLGGGSNVVIADSGFDGLIVDLAVRGVHVTHEAERVTLRAAAGEPWDELVARAVASGLQGLECLSGIPGRVGATPIQNVGAYGQDVSETITEVVAFDQERNERVCFSNEACGFGYRSSRFKSPAANRYVILEVCFQLRHGAAPTLRYAELERAFASERAPSLLRVREAVLSLRRSKSMLVDPDDPNARGCGSFFVNPALSADEFEVFRERASRTGPAPSFLQSDGRTKLSAGWLIEQAGFARGTRDGHVGLSTKHALALITFDGASAEQVLRFAERVQAGVRERFGVELHPEPVFWGNFPQDAASLSAPVRTPA